MTTKLGEKGKLTFAQMKILERLATEPDAMLINETRDRGYLNSPSFHSRWYRKHCPTCGHREKGEPASWRAVFALEEKGLIAPLLREGTCFTKQSITDAGRKALEQKHG